MNQHCEMNLLEFFAQGSDTTYQVPSLEVPKSEIHAAIGWENITRAFGFGCINIA